MCATETMTQSDKLEIYTYLANELWTPFTKSKFPIASPRKAGVKLAVNTLNP